MRVISISREVAKGFEFDLDLVENTEVYKSTNLKEGVDYEWGYERGDDFPSTIIILDESREEEIRTFYKELKKQV